MICLANPFHEMQMKVAMAGDLAGAGLQLAQMRPAPSASPGAGRALSTPARGALTSHVSVNTAASGLRLPAMICFLAGP